MVYKISKKDIQIAAIQAWDKLDAYVNDEVEDGEDAEEAFKFAPSPMIYVLLRDKIVLRAGLHTLGAQANPPDGYTLICPKHRQSNTDWIDKLGWQSIFEEFEFEDKYNIQIGDKICKSQIE